MGLRGSAALPEGCVDGCDEGGHAGGEGEIGRGFQGVTEPGLERQQEE